MLRTSILAGMILAGLSLAAEAANIHLVRSGGGATIIVDGIIAPGDDQKFIDVAKGISAAEVSLKSPGGRTETALSIGRQISLRGFSTFVPPHAMCASACGFIWLAGKPHRLPETSKLGFHASYILNAGQITISSDGNAIVGAYLRDLGFSYEAIAYFTRAGARSMQWMTDADAKRFGIRLDRNNLIAHSGMQVEKGTEIVASSYDIVHGHSFAQCRDECAGENACKGFNYYPSHTCVKFAESIPTRENDMVMSGIKLK